MNAGETLRNFSIRQPEHENTTHYPERARHMASNQDHSLDFSDSGTQRRTLEVVHIAKYKPNLKKQANSYCNMKLHNNLCNSFCYNFSINLVYFPCFF